MRVSLEEASDLLKSGRVVAVPTETVYGLAASLSYPEAIQKVFDLKNRPSDNPLIIHLASAEEIGLFTKQLPSGCLKIAEAFWPGPLTLVLPALVDAIPEIARASLPTAAFRVPEHPLARSLIQKTGPLVMPSANLSGRPSSTSAEHVESDFGYHFPVLDGGKCTKGVESTILFWTEGAWAIVRLGAIPPEAFFPVLGYYPEVLIHGATKDRSPLCPGQLYRHYSPKARLKLVKKFYPEMTGWVIGFDDRSYPQGCRLLSLGHSKDSEEASKRLYDLLRQLDREGIAEAWVDADLPEAGLWLTLKERLFKAAHS
jgi:L-threonylcarbamoyladenylate synthase